MESLLARLREPVQRARIRSEILENRMTTDNIFLLLDWKDIQIGDCPQDRPCEGKNLSEILRHDAPSPSAIDALMDWLLHIKANALMVCQNQQSEDDVAHVLAHPLSAVASDAWIVPWQKGSPHPRAYGSIPRFLGRYVRDKKLMRLEEGVRKATSATAIRYGLTGRGILAEGMIADVAVWDPETIIDCADYSNPHQYPKGIRWVFVNGQAALADGSLTGAAVGRILRARDAG